MFAYNHGGSREGDRFEVTIDIVRLSIFVTTIIDIDKDGDGNDSENGIKKGEGMRFHPCQLTRLCWQIL